MSEERMSIPFTLELSDSELKEWLKHSKNFILTVDEIIDLIPYSASDSIKQKILRLLFMEVRSAAYDICVLAESLLNNETHFFSRSIEAARRQIFEDMIDYFYISESDNSVALQRTEFLLVVGTPDEKTFRKRYKIDKRGDYWSGKSRKEKIEQGMQKYPPLCNERFLANIVGSAFSTLNEFVHGNTMVALHLTLDKQGEYADEYRGQIGKGLAFVFYFYLVTHAYLNFNGSGSEIERIDFYFSYVSNTLIKDSEAHNEDI